MSVSVPDQVDESRNHPACAASKSDVSAAEGAEVAVPSSVPPTWGILDLQGDIVLTGTSGEGTSGEGLSISDIAVPLPEFAPNAGRTDTENAQAQGNDASSVHATRVDRGGVTLGMFSYDTRGRPVLEIGNHRLEGKAVDLKTPFAVLKKRKRMCDSPSPQTAYDVVGVVRTRILFNTRPKPIKASR